MTAAAKPLMNPHNDCVTNDPPGPGNRRWTCRYCGASGALDDLVGPGQLAPCTYVYPPCTTCGQTPVCAADCAAVWGALANLPPGVKLVGTPPPIVDKKEKERPS